MNIFWRELRAHWKGLAGWSIGMLFLVVAGMGKFEGYSASGASNISELLASFPKSISAIFGMTGLDLTTLIGYFGVLYLYIALMVAIHAGMLGAEIIIKEERDKTSEFLYPKPITRTKVLTAKLATALINILVLFGATVASSIMVIGFYNKNYAITSQLMELMWGILFFQLLAFAFGAFFAGVLKSPKLAPTAVTTVIMSAYLVSVVAQLSNKLEFLKYLTPFWFFGAPKILADGHLDIIYATVSFIIILGLFVSTYIFYNRRDLNV